MRPIYRTKPIANIKSLATAIGLSPPALKDLAANAESQYTYFSIPKSNGKQRQVCSPGQDLKIVQKRINRAIFGNIEYPDYLFGGIENRDYVLNARAHRGAKTLIALDIKDFYPNIKSQQVHDIFKLFCRFPDQIATILTQLTTLHGFVPQGACTSSHLANLVFHDTEHRIVRIFHQKKLVYTRLLDDICISSHKELSKQAITDVIEHVRVVLKDKGFKLHSDKTRITSTSNPEQLMEITGLWLNRGQPRVHRRERIDIRSEVRRCEKMFSISKTDPDYHKEHNRISGRISKLTYIGHAEAAAYRLRIGKILPTYEQAEINKTTRLVRIICTTPPHDRDKYSFIERYHTVMYRLGIVARTNPSLAAEQRVKLSTFRPTQTLDGLIYGSNP